MKQPSHREPTAPTMTVRRAAFADDLERIPPERTAEWVRDADEAAVRRALGAPRIEPRDLAALISPAAAPFLETIAQRAHHTTIQRHGRVVTLYVPLYLSNFCINHCIYCGFKAGIKRIKRHTLTPEQLEAEMDRLQSLGFRHILLVSGEDRSEVSVDFMVEAIRMAGKKFDSVSIEVDSLDDDSYARVIDAGCDGMALYQETYDRRVYKWAHPGRGPKSDFDWRLGAPERAGKAGMRSIGIGALLGLGVWYFEVIALLLHARFLAKHFWQTKISISFPRLRDETGGFKARYPLGDREFVQLYCALRIALPDAEFVISTREAPMFRDHLIRIGVNRLSAGSKTTPGGYVEPTEAGPQFAISDDRSAEAVARRIEQLGFEAVWKDWDRGLSAPPANDRAS